MARIQIDLPASFSFSTELDIYIGHINYGNHLDNVQLLALVSEARVRYLKAMGYSELQVEGVGMLVADAAVQYRTESFHGERLRIELQAMDFNKYGCDLVWRITEVHSDREVARGKTGILCFDYQARKPVLIPSAFLDKLQTTSFPK